MQIPGALTALALLLGVLPVLATRPDRVGHLRHDQDEGRIDLAVGGAVVSWCVIL
jgi:hypothetical protein